MRAATRCDLSSLDKAAFGELLELYPESKSPITRAAMRRMQRDMEVNRTTVGRGNTVVRREAFREIATSATSATSAISPRHQGKCSSRRNERRSSTSGEDALQLQGRASERRTSFHEDTPGWTYKDLVEGAPSGSPKQRAAVAAHGYLAHVTSARHAAPGASRVSSGAALSLSRGSSSSSSSLSRPYVFSPPPGRRAWARARQFVSSREARAREERRARDGAGVSGRLDGEPEELSVREGFDLPASSSRPSLRRMSSSSPGSPGSPLKQGGGATAKPPWDRLGLGLGLGLGLANP